MFETPERARAARSGVSVRCVESIATIPAAAWDACAGADNPFVGHPFLLALEESGSVAEATGWSPYHLAAEDAAGDLVACAPLYLKSHSYGEYVFDWGWAEAWQRAGKRYYPKLQCAVPFTPVAGPRLMVRPGQPSAMLAPALGDVMVGLVERGKLSSAHVTFASEAQARLLAERGWLLRMGEQFHWHNRGYASFDAFLDTLSSRKRKAIRREREGARAHGFVLRTLSGPEIDAARWDAFHRFYCNTIDRKWGHPYLTREFWSRIGATMGDKVALMVAERDGETVACALNIEGGDTLYGRTWGAAGDFRFLHFELCYYRAIEHAIARGLARVEAGAQGEHKISRGYLPVSTWSAHWIADASLRRAVSRFLEAERKMLAEAMAAQSEAGPYRREAD